MSTMSSMPASMAEKPITEPEPPKQSTQPPKEGGFAGWLTVFGAFWGLFATFGQLNTFGSFQAYYVQNQLAAYSPSEISWIGSLQLWVFFFSVRCCSPATVSRTDIDFGAGGLRRPPVRRVWTPTHSLRRHLRIHVRSHDDLALHSLLPVYPGAGYCCRSRNWPGVSLSASWKYPLLP